MKNMKKVESKPLPKLIDVNAETRPIVLKLSKKLQQEMTYCHHVVGDVEWSGTLIYKFENPKMSIEDFYNKEDESNSR